jgi:hypothetical protein
VAVSSRADSGVADEVRGTIHGRAIAEIGEVEIVFGEAQPPLPFRHHRLLAANVEIPSLAILAPDGLVKPRLAPRADDGSWPPALDALSPRGHPVRRR